MKKLLIITTLIVTLALEGCGKSENSVTTNPSSFATESEALQPIRLIDSDDMVYIEGITVEAANTIDSVFRYYEATDGAESTDGELAWIYNPLRPAITDWFDPGFDLVETFKVLKETDKTGSMETGTLAWIINPLSAELTSENADDIFYYRPDAELNGYIMSSGYFYLGYAYSNMCQN